MPRSPRTDVGDIAYHVLNRANARLPIFTTDTDYQAFERVLGEAQQRSRMPILTYCVMPNHWHLVIYPPADGMLVSFMCWLSMTHTQRWHAAHETTGTGHLYDGRLNETAPDPVSPRWERFSRLTTATGASAWR